MSSAPKLAKVTMIPPPPPPAVLAKMRAELQAGVTPVGEIPQPQPDRVATLRLVARSTTIIGKILDGISERYGVSHKPAALIVRAGRILWAIVEAAVPRSMANLLVRYWFAVLLLIEALMIVGGTLFNETGVQPLGIKLLLFTLGARALVEVTHFYLEGRKLLRTIAVGFFLGVAGFVVLGWFYFSGTIAPAALKWSTQHGSRAMDFAKQNPVLVTGSIVVIIVAGLCLYVWRAHSRRVLLQGP